MYLVVWEEFYLNLSNIKKKRKISDQIDSKTDPLRDKFIEFRRRNVKIVWVVKVFCRCSKEKN